MFVAGKGGTGKTTIAAALALIAARRGRRVLAIEVDAKGDLPEALGHPPVGFSPVVVRPNLSVLSLQTEESFQEYLRIFFKVPRFARMTPLAGVFDFIATGVPGPREMLVVGKIAHEERRRENDEPVWDLIVVDSSASGEVLTELSAPQAMMKLVRGGMLRSQVDFVHATLSDHRRTVLCITALAEEMPVVEALELHSKLGRTEVALGPCFLNRVIDAALTPRQRTIVNLLTEPRHAQAAAAAVGPGVAAVAGGALLADQLSRASQPFASRLVAGMSVPVVSIPLVAARSGLATTRAVASRLEETG